MLKHFLPDVAWPAARSAALWAFCRRHNAPYETFWSQRETTHFRRRNSRRASPVRENGNITANQSSARVDGLRGSKKPEVPRQSARACFIKLSCRFTTYRHRFARVAPAPRAKLIDSKNRGRASPVKNYPPARHHHFIALFSWALPINVVWPTAARRQRSKEA